MTTATTWTSHARFRRLFGVLWLGTHLLGMLLLAALLGMPLPGMPRLGMAGLSAQQPPKATQAIVVDMEGQETALQQVEWSGNVRRLAWLADPNAADEDGRRGPLALVIREPNSTTLTQGVLTLVPVRSLAAVEFDYDRQFVTYRIQGLQQALTGTLQYRGINTFTLTGLTAAGEKRTFSGGVRGGQMATIRSVTFPQAQPLPRRREGLSWNVQILQPTANDPLVPARNLKPLFALAGGRERLLDALPLRKAEPLPFGPQLLRWEMLAHDPNTHHAAAEVTLAGQGERLVIIPLTLPEEGQTAQLLGLLGETDAGWKLFPLHTIRVITPSKRKIE